jgi:single-strand DNA-binding protein
MADYNLVVLVGRLTRDPELKYTADNGTPFARLSLAVNRQVNMPDGNYQKATTFVDVSIWKHQAELVCQYLKKGSTCLVSGFLEQLRWTDKQNQKRSKLRVRAQRIQFMDRRPPEAVPAGSGAAEDAAPEEGAEAPPGDEE